MRRELTKFQSLQKLERPKQIDFNNRKKFRVDEISKESPKLEKLNSDEKKKLDEEVKKIDDIDFHGVRKEEKLIVKKKQNSSYISSIDRDQLNNKISYKIGVEKKSKNSTKVIISQKEGDNESNIVTLQIDNLSNDGKFS